MAYRLGVVEDDGQFRSSVVEILKTDSPDHQIRTWRSAEEFWNDEGQEDLDLVFLDIQLPHMSGVELARMVRVKFPELRMIMLTHVTSDETIFRALKAGALGYVLKSELHDLPALTRVVMEGGSVITPTIAFRVLRSFRDTAPEEDYNLTKRERQILETLSRGTSTKKTAEILGIAENTLRNHVKNIYRKLNVRNQLEMMRKASEMGLI